MTERLRLLLLEDHESDAQLVLDQLAQAGLEVESTRVESRDEFLQNIDQDWDLIIADYTLPQFRAPDALQIMKERSIGAPLIVVTGSISEEVAVECMKLGAADYLLKESLVRLGPAVRQALAKRDLEREKALAARERSRLVRILESTSGLVGILGQDWQLTYMNRAGLELLGLSQKWLEQAASFRNFLTTESWKSIQEQAVPGALDHGTWDGEGELVSADGRIIPVLLVIIAHHSEDHELEFFSILARDISERKAYEHRIQEQLDRLSALRSIDLAITSSLDPKLTFDVLLEQVTSVMGVDAADILLFDPDSQMLSFAAGRGFRTRALQHTHLRIGEGHAGRAALERSQVHLQDLFGEDSALARSPELAQEGFQSYYATPLIARGQIKGILELFHRGALQGDEEWLNFLDTLARQAAIAIENTTLFSSLQRANIDLVHAYDATIEGWARALEHRDIETEGHSRRVTEATIRLARALGLSMQQIAHIRRGALLHDIGKMSIPDSILLKSGPLTDEEWEIMRRHPQNGYDLLAPISFLRPALEIPYCHHEKWDGTGYPRGLAGEAIPLEARIFAVADVWDALRSDRPYREAWDESKALDYIKEQTGQHFDPQVVDAFLDWQSQGR